MAVQTRYLSNEFPTVGGSLFLEEYGACVPTAPAGIGNTTVLSDFTRSELTCSYGFGPRKRPRLAADAPAAGYFLDDRRVVMAPAVMPNLVPVPVGDVQSRGVGSDATSTSGRVANGATLSRGLLLPRLYQSGDIDALVTLESERMRAGLKEAQRRHARALLAAVERAASAGMRAADAELERAVRCNAELEEKARQMGAECQAWMGVAKSHEAVAAGLRTALHQLLHQSRCATAAMVGDSEGEAEDAQSCCFEASAANGDDAAPKVASPCKACGCGEARVLLLPCRHLCLCRACEAAADACPVCATPKNASLHVLLP